MSASLRSPEPVGAREPVSGSGQVAVSERGPVVHRRRGRLVLIDSSGPAEQVALRGELEQSGGRATAPGSGVAERDRCSHPGPGSPCSPCGTKERAERPSRRPATLGRRPAAHDRQTGLNLDGVDGHAEQEALAVSPGRSGGLVLSSRRPRPGARPGSRFGCRRGVAGLVMVCVLTLGAAACSLKDAKAEASVSASASASAAIARAEKGIADANASATASREAALTPELRAKRDAALAEPAPAKPEQMNDQTREGAAMTAWYFLELYRYAYMTGNTTELAKMSEDRCVFCKSVIDRATKLHEDGGWTDKWDQEITNYTYYEKIEGYDYNELDVTANQGKVVSHPGGGKDPTISDPKGNQVLDFAIRYNGTRWMIGGVRVLEQ